MSEKKNTILLHIIYYKHVIYFYLSIFKKGEKFLFIFWRKKRLKIFSMTLNSPLVGFEPMPRERQVEWMQRVLVQLDDALALSATKSHC